MNYNNLDVWAVQYNKEDLSKALKNWKHDENTILFTNTNSIFVLGETLFSSKQFDTFLYSEGNDKLVMAMRDGAININDFKQALADKQIFYHEVSFCPLKDEYEDESDLPQLWLARDLDVLEEFIDDSANSEKANNGSFYPNVEGYLSLGYTGSGPDGKRSSYDIEGRVFNGVIQMEDKMILLINNLQKSFHPAVVCQLLDEYGVHYILSNETSLPLVEEIKNQKK